MIATPETVDVSAAVPHSRLGVQPRNLQIQWLRALAAIMVVLYHASIYGVLILENGSFISWFDGRFGMFGVSLFFSISGYLMATALSVQEPFTFLAHRVLRIYPGFLGVVALFWLLNLALDQQIYVNFAALTLAPVGAEARYPLKVEWTLVFEVVFYTSLFVISLCGLARRLSWIALAWLAMLAGSSLLRPDPGGLVYPVQRILTVCENVGMAGGLLIPALLRLRLPPLLLMVTGAAAWPLYGLYPLDNEGGRWLFGAGATLVVAGAVGVAQARPEFGNNRIGRSAARFGDYSYALYLLHVPIIRSLYQHVRSPVFAVLWVLGVSLAILLSLPVGRLDVRLYRYLKSSLKRVKALPLRAAVCAYLLILVGVAAPAGWKLHVAAVRQENARKIAVAIASAGPVATQPQLEAAARKAGLTSSASLAGAVEAAGQINGMLKVTGWAVDTRADRGVMSVALFQDGHVLDATSTSYGSGELHQRFATKAKTGFAVLLALPCEAGSPVIGLALGPNHSFALLQGAPLPDCRNRHE